MSLINKVLKDLDKRKQKENASDSPAQGLKPRYKSGLTLPTLNKKWLLIIVIIIALIAAAVGLLMQSGKSTTNEASKTSNSQTKQLSKSANNQETNKQSSTSDKKESSKSEKQQSSGKEQDTDKTQAQQQKQEQQEKTSVAQIVSAHIRVSKEHLTKVKFGLSQAVKYRIDHEQSQDSKVIVLHLFDAKADNLDLQLPKSLSALQQIKQDGSKQGEYIIRFNLHSGAKLQSINMDKQADPVTLSLSFVLPAKQRQKIKQSIMAVTRAKQKKQSLEEAKKEYKQALKPLKKGEYSEARHQLTKIVHQHPAYFKARVTLVKLLLKHNELQQAYQYLRHALEKRPDNIQLIMLKARYYYQQNLLQKALDTLESIDPPSLKEHPQYYAFTAAMQRQLGNDKVAAQLYKQLLNMAPERSVWWLGLALAYEDNGQSNSAQRAYKKALDTGNLNPNLQAYVSSKLR